MTESVPSPIAVITGVSSGIGLGLTREALSRGWTVLGTGLAAPDLGKADRFHFVPCDLSRQKEIAPAFKRLLKDTTELDLVVLNAGILGPFGDLHEHSLEDIHRVMQVNVWANKILLDLFTEWNLTIKQIVGITATELVYTQRGWGGYALSKSALNTLLALAAAENDSTHYCAFAPGLVDTAMMDQLCSVPDDPRFPSLETLRSNRGTSAMPDASEASPAILDAILSLPKKVKSGSFIDIRSMPKER